MGSSTSRPQAAANAAQCSGAELHKQHAPAPPVEHATSTALLRFCEAPRPPLYPAELCRWPRERLQSLITERYLAPRLRGLDDVADATVARECSICMLAYAAPWGLNSTRCCGRPMCSECFLHTSGSERGTAPCPFCQAGGLAVHYPARLEAAEADACLTANRAGIDPACAPAAAAAAPAALAAGTVSVAARDALLESIAAQDIDFALRRVEGLLTAPATGAHLAAGDGGPAAAGGAGSAAPVVDAHADGGPGGSTSASAGISGRRQEPLGEELEALEAAMLRVALRASLEAARGCQRPAGDGDDRSGGSGA